MSKLKAVILAAGAGTRMVSDVPKVLHKVLEKPMLSFVVEAAREAGATEVCVVIGHKGDIVKETLKDQVQFVVQEEQLGTGHAVMQAEDFIGEDGKVLILFGDTPLITGKTLKEMVQVHEKEGNAVTVLSTIVSDSTGYGRIVRDENQLFVKSVEHKDATIEQRQIKEINSGMYCFEAKYLREALKSITNQNAQGEYYLPDTLIHIMKQNLKANAMVTERFEEVLGVNDRVQLAAVSKIMQKRINEGHMRSGVTMIDPEAVYISKETEIGADTILYPGTILEGTTKVGEGCIIGPNTRIVNSVIEAHTSVEASTVLSSHVGSETHVGPYAYIRPNCSIGKHVKIGDFVEIKNAVIGNGTKVSHLTYIGDADVGDKVNFGCGTVVVNYDGVHKHRTTVKDGAFIGCNTNLVSPVVVEEHAYTAAGSTITKDVPPYALGIARERQVNINDWVRKKQQK